MVVKKKTHLNQEKGSYFTKGYFMKLSFYEGFVETCECCGSQEEGWFEIDGKKIHSYPYPNPVSEFGTPTDACSFINGYIQCLIDQKIINEKEITLEYID